MAFAPAARECDLRGCLLPRCNGLYQIDQGHVGFEGVRSETGNVAPEIGLVERGVCIDFAREKSGAERAERDEPNAEFLQCGQHFRLGTAIPQRVFALNGRHRLDGMGAAYCFNARLRKAEMFNFAFCDQLLHRARHIFDRNRGVNAMLIEQVDSVSLEAFERCFRDRLEVFGPAVEASTALAPSGDGGRGHSSMITFEIRSGLP